MLHTLSGKVTLGILLYAVVLVFMAGGTLRGAQATENATRQLADETLVEATLNEALIFRLARTMTELVSAGAQQDADELAEANENLVEARAILGELALLQATHGGVAGAALNAQRLALIERLEQDVARLDVALAAGDPGEIAEVLEGQEGVDVLIEALIVEQNEHMQLDAAAAVGAVADNVRIARVILPLQYTAIGLLIAFAAWLLHRLVVRPVRDLADAATAVGEGRLDQPITHGGLDEVGVLQRAFSQMVERLRDRDRAVERQIDATQVALAQLERRAAEQARLVADLEQQREVVRNLSVPVLPISSRLLVMPLVGALDSERQRLVQSQALQAIERSGARTLLLDVTGVPVVDAEVARGLLGVVQAARLLGARVVLVGIRPEVAQAMVGLDFPLEQIRSQPSLQAGIEEALRAEQQTRAVLRPARVTVPA